MAKRNNDLTKDQQKELKAIFKNVVKKELKKNSNNPNILTSTIITENDKSKLEVNGYFFTISGSIGAPEAYRWNIIFRTKFYDTVNEAFARLKELAANKNNYNFSRVKITDPDALYQNVFESICEE